MSDDSRYDDAISVIEREIHLLEKNLAESVDPMYNIWLCGRIQSLREAVDVLDGTRQPQPSARGTEDA